MRSATDLDLAAEWGLYTKIDLDDTLLESNLNGAQALDNAELGETAVRRIVAAHQH
ncbi:hypothetical protein ACWD9K_36380 [Streptomyces sp. 900116325]